MSRLVTRYLQHTGCLVLLLCCVSTMGLASDVAETVVIRQSNIADIKNEDYYFYHLLELVLSKTDTTTQKTIIKQLPYRLEDKRLRTEMMHGVVDVLWSPTSTEFEQQMLPIRISLLRDLNNYRLLLIRKNDQPRFSAIRSIEDLRKLKGGMGSQWTDANIMEYNELPLVQAVGYEKLFKMLAAKRFDYFSRGLYQIQSEVNFYPELELQIEQELMLGYSNEVYFFVGKDNAALAKRIEKGLRIALDDGSFDELFNRIPRYRWGNELLKTHQRRVIELRPLPADLPAVDE